MYNKLVNKKKKCKNSLFIGYVYTDLEQVNKLPFDIFTPSSMIVNKII